MYWKGRPQSANVTVDPDPVAAAKLYLQRYHKASDATQNEVERDTEHQVDEAQDMARPTRASGK